MKFVLRCTGLFLLFLLFEGGAVFAADSPTLTILPDKAVYFPNDTVIISVRAASGVQIRARVLYLNTEITTLESALTDGEAILTWTPPPDAPRGYGLSLDVLDDAGNVIASQTAAFDVLNHWIEAPRYGFFSDFNAARLTDQPTRDWLRMHHINGIQFYDWQYRWENLVPDTDRFDDGLGRPQSMTTIRRLIDVAHSVNAAAMPYTAIYGASTPFYREHPDWGLFDTRGVVYDFGENSFLAIMNPASGSPWTNHLMNEFTDVLENTNFDGIHIDQYGSPKTGYDSAGNYVDLAQVMPQFIDSTAAIVQAERGDNGVTLFNCVGNWPIAAVAPSEQDASYIEVWSPNNDYLDLNRIITNAETLGNGKPVILAAYIPPERTLNWQIANSVILASGGTHLETGEPESMLADPYFPLFGTLTAEQMPVFRRYYDFQVRYENVLSVNTVAADHERHNAVDLGEIRTRGIRTQNRVVPIVRSGESFETISLVNFMGVEDTDWNAPTNTPPTPFNNLDVTVAINQSVSAVWVASPDSEVSMNAINLPYTVENGILHFTLPELNFWSMIVVEYSNER